MHMIHIVVVSALLLSPSCVLSEEEIMDSAHADVLEDTSASLVGARAAGVYSVTSGTRTPPAAAPDAVALEDTAYGPDWTCVARHRYCEEDDDGGGGFELCHESFYYAVDRDRDEARDEALDRCEHDHPGDRWRCRIMRCYR